MKNLVCDTRIIFNYLTLLIHSFEIKYLVDHLLQCKLFSSICNATFSYGDFPFQSKIYFLRIFFINSIKITEL